jgi:site-specific DNA recombinase
VAKITKLSADQNLAGVSPRLRVAAYCRVSTDSDEQLASLESQKAHYESLIRNNPSWQFAGVYFDEGISGTKREKRKELLRLLADCESKRIDFIVTKSISRFARNTTDCLEIVRSLTGQGVFIYFENENINTQSMDSELMLTILSSLAESESISISQNNKWSVQRRFQNGTFKLSYPPYGYSLCQGELTVNEEQAVIVRRIFADALSGLGTQIIARNLNAAGIPARKGGRWASASVRGMLGNEKYTGDMILQKKYTDDHFNRHYNYGEKEQYLIKNNHDAIISHEDFTAVENILMQNGKEKGVEKGSAKYQNRYPFSGKVKCSECGSSFKRRIYCSGDKKYIAWCCARHIIDSSGCSMRFIRESSIQQAFVTMINKLIFGHKLVLKPLHQNLRAVNDANNLARIQDLETKIMENTERGKVLVSIMAKGYLEPDLFNAQSIELKKEAVALKEQKEILSRSVNGGMTTITELEQLIKFVSKADQMLDHFDADLFDRFVGTICVCSQTEINFKLKCGITLGERLVG